MLYRVIDGKMVRVNNDSISPIKKPVENIGVWRNENESIFTNKDNGYILKSSMMSALALAPVTAMASQGVFWGVFLEYVFPWFIDIAKVFCAIKIAQAFYMEKRGGRDEGGGITSMISYGKWLLLFHLLPWGVELIDEIGKDMLDNVRRR